MRQAHRLGMSTTATMMYGHVETVEERVEHMRRIRDLQDEQPRLPRLHLLDVPARQHAPRRSRSRETPTSFDYLLTQAVSRIYLDNVDHIQSSWVTQGLKIGQVALHFGADDLGTIMIEENVVSAAGTTYRAAIDDFCRLIRGDRQAPRAARHAVPPRARRLLARSWPRTPPRSPALLEQGDHMELQRLVLEEPPLVRGRRSRATACRRCAWSAPRPRLEPGDPLADDLVHLHRGAARGGRGARTSAAATTTAGRRSPAAPSGRRCSCCSTRAPIRRPA